MHPAHNSTVIRYIHFYFFTRRKQYLLSQIQKMEPKRQTVLVTGANGYIGNAVAKAFNRAGWKTYGLIRRDEDAPDLRQNEVYPVIGTPKDIVLESSLQDLIFDVVVSNTEDWSNYEAHFEDVKAMLVELGKRKLDQTGKRLLVLFSSGCKDYGMTERHGDPSLVAHTESSPLNVLRILEPRAVNVASLLEETTTRESKLPFDMTVLRPTNVYGYGSSFYGALFSFMEKGAAENDSLKVFADPNNIMHSAHVDDCADAYVALAEHPRRDEVSGQAFNISNARYETAGEILQVLAKSYGVTIEYQPQTRGSSMSGVIEALLQYTQWVSSEKIRHVTGWKEKHPLFVDGIEEYRLAYEAAVAAKHHGTLKIRSTLDGPSGLFNRWSKE
jgi:nucleoside-diphosphate-sugar epimerase